MVPEARGAGGCGSDMGEPESHYQLKYQPKVIRKQAQNNQQHPCFNPVSTLFQPCFNPVYSLLSVLCGCLYQGLDMPRQFRRVNFALLQAIFYLALPCLFPMYPPMMLSPVRSNSARRLASAQPDRYRFILLSSIFYHSEAWAYRACMVKMIRQ